MKNKLRLLAVALIAGGTMFAETHLSIGVGIGTGYGPAYAAPAYVVPPCPGPGYNWVDGYWGPQHVWVNGFWRAPRVIAYPVAPRYYAPPRYYNSYRGWDRDDRYRGHEERYRGHEDRGRGWGNGWRR
jgi:hypothetical protein